MAHPERAADLRESGSLPDQAVPCRHRDDSSEATEPDDPQLEAAVRYLVGAEDGRRQEGRERSGPDGARVKVFASNRKAYYDYHVLESIEAGLALTGTEIKSIRAGRVNLRDGYARVQNGEVWLYNMHISPYDQGNIYNHEPMRPRKLLLHKGEIGRLASKSQEQGLTLVPLRMYERKGHAKVELAVAREEAIRQARGDLAARGRARGRSGDQRGVRSTGTLGFDRGGGSENAGRGATALVNQSARQ